MTKHERRNNAKPPVSSLVIRISNLIRHSSFEFRIFGGPHHLISAFHFGLMRIECTRDFARFCSSFAAGRT